MNVRRVFYLILALLLTGCATGSSVTYNVGIDQVERPSDAQERYGEYTVTEQDTTEGTEYVYEDDLLKAGWLYVGGAMLVSVENKTDYSFRILLNEGAFVLPSGGSQRILTGNMSYASRNDEVQPIIVPKGASSTAVLIPSSNLKFSELQGGYADPIVSPDMVTTNPQKGDVEDNVGKTFSILFPIEIRETVRPIFSLS